jgi:hypothetical protein
LQKKLRGHPEERRECGVSLDDYATMFETRHPRSAPHQEGENDFPTSTAISLVKPAQASNVLEKSPINNATINRSVLENTNE